MCEYRTATTRLTSTKFIINSSILFPWWRDGLESSVKKFGHWTGPKFTVLSLINDYTGVITYLRAGLQRCIADHRVSCSALTVSNDHALDWRVRRSPHIDFRSNCSGMFAVSYNNIWFMQASARIFALGPTLRATASLLRRSFATVDESYP